MRNLVFEPEIPDRIVSALSYLTAGWGGLIYMVILYFARKNASKFLRFNVFQSIFISFAVFVIAMIYNLLFDILTHIPLIQIAISWLDLLLNKPTFGHYSLLQGCVLVYLCYVVILSLLGKFPILWKISRLFFRV